MRTLFCITLLLISLSSAWAQTFTGMGTLGFNMSQLDGDASTGYNRIGLSGGARVAFPLGESTGLQVGILYNHKGARNRTEEPNFLSYKLHYVDLSTDFVYRALAAEDDKKGEYKRLEAFAGLSFGRLFGGEINIGGFGNELDRMKNWDFAGQLGGRFFFTYNLGLELAWSRSILSMHRQDRLVGHMLSIRGIYRF